MLTSLDLRLRAPRLAIAVLAALCSAAAISVAVPAAAQAARTQCVTRSVTYNGRGNFFDVFHETLSAEVCYNGRNVWVIWTNHRFSAVPGWNDTELGRGVFWDPTRYGGALTIWSNARDTFGWGPFSWNQDTFLRIWVKPNGQTWTYGGP